MDWAVETQSESWKTLKPAPGVMREGIIHSNSLASGLEREGKNPNTLSQGYWALKSRL